MKNIQVIDGAENSVYDIFSATDDEFGLIFPGGTDIAFIDEVMERCEGASLKAAFKAIWTKRVAKKDAMGIHGILFYGPEEKKCTIRPAAMKRRLIRAARPCAEMAMQLCRICAIPMLLAGGG